MALQRRGVEHLACVLLACARRVLEMSPNRCQQPTVASIRNLRNLKLMRAFSPGVTHENTLVMRHSAVPVPCPIER
jgi:hypothetical protein